MIDIRTPKVSSLITESLPETKAQAFSAALKADVQVWLDDFHSYKR